MRTFRDKIKKQDDDELSRGQLPRDFTFAIPVTLIEAHAFLQKRSQDEKTFGAPGMKMDNAVVSGCVEYVNTQKERFQGETYISDARKRSEIKMTYPGMVEPVELTQLLNLRPRDVDEAKMLITSLEKFEEPADMEALGQIIGIINRDEHTDE